MAKRGRGNFALTPKQQKTAVRLAKLGIPFKKIAEQFDVTGNTISATMTRLGFSKGWRTKKIEKMKLEKIQLVKAELKKNPNIGSVVKKYGISYSILWNRGISLKNSKELKIGKKLRPKFLKCKLCGASLENNRFDRNLLCLECGRKYSNENSRLSHRRKRNKSRMRRNTKLDDHINEIVRRLAEREKPRGEAPVPNPQGEA
jgi:hypothetical protein